MDATGVPRDGKDFVLFGIAGMVAVGGVLWLAGAASALLTGYRVPPGRPFAGLLAFAHFGDPSLAWHGPVGPAALYWAVTFLVLFAPAAVVLLVWRRLVLKRRRNVRPDRTEGVAKRHAVAGAAGSRVLLARGSILRPSLGRLSPSAGGYRVGRSCGVDCWVSVEDSMLCLGPPRSGKGTSIVIPMILDAPGAVVTTSTRPDNLAVTLAARRALGPVAVFDPQGLGYAPGLTPSLRWSLVGGCERVQTAMLRAEALVPASGRLGVENGTFWRQQALSVVRCLLHAAALDGRPPAELYRWSHSAAGAKEAVAVLAQSAGAAGWDLALDSVISADQRTRDSVWALVANTFSPLADPAVLAAVSPAGGEHFDPVSFLEHDGTLFLLGSASGAAATASLVAALIEDVIDAAKRLAARSPGARLDPPVALLLDEAANYPLPSLPSLISEGGGSGITTLAVLQSLAQARDRWGREAAGAIWDSAIAKIILGGSANAEDLAGISKLIGEREVKETTRTHGTASAGGSVSVSVCHRPVLEPSQIRQIPVGHGLLLLRSAAPIMMTLNPWTCRPDASTLRAAKNTYEVAARSAGGA